MTLQGDGVPGVTMTAVVSPAAGWVRVSRTSRASGGASAAGSMVLDRAGHREVAAAWLTAARGEREGIQIDGAAIVAPDQVAGVAVRERGGQGVRRPPNMTSRCRRKDSLRTVET